MLGKTVIKIYIGENMHHIYKKTYTKVMNAYPLQCRCFFDDPNECFANLVHLSASRVETEK